MGLYKRNDSPVWWMCFSVNRKAYQRSTGTENKRLAEAILAKVKTQVIEGKWFDKEIKLEYKFKELADKYLEWIKDRQRGAFKKAYVVKQLIDRFGNYELNSFTTHTLEQYQNERLQKGNKPATINRFIETARHMLTKAYDWDMVTEGTLRSVRKVKLLSVNNCRLRYLSKEECQTLINSCDPHLKPIVITALNTGMRRGEILSLEWERHIDLKHGFILLDKTKNGERREIPINQTLRNALQGLLRRIDISYVFYDSLTGKPYQEVRRSFKTALRRAGIKDFRFHDLRHTFASHLIMAGVDLTTVKELLGHKDIKMTLRYAHLAPSHKVQAVEIYDNLLNKKTTALEGKNQMSCYDFMTVGINSQITTL